MLPGLMQDSPLSLTALMRQAKTQHGQREIVSVTSDNPRYRYTYADAFDRAAQVAHGLAALGMREGDRVATLAWNDHRHFELYYGISCSGGVCHTVNPRLYKEQIKYILQHAEDRWVFADPAFIAVLEDMQDELGDVEQFVVLTDVANMPITRLKSAVSYEEFIAGHSVSFDWPQLDEHAASTLCYTSGTTGDPKGVLFSHRATVLHALSVSLPDAMCLQQGDCVMPLVPMFHVNAWGIPYAAPMVGAKLVLPGSSMGDGAALQKLITHENVSFSLGVPTVWLNLLAYLDSAAKTIDPLQRICVGGAACPAVVIERFESDFGVQVSHGWGMTEMSPVGSYNAPKYAVADMANAGSMALRLRQGRALVGVEMKIVDDAGAELAWDGVSAGTLKVRGPTVCSAYFKDDAPILDSEGWFDTGDVATIDADGFMQITDRTKDIIKSGGEWISSIQLENTAVNHPDVAEAAVIGIAHSKWQERPLLIVVLKESARADRQHLLSWFDGKVADWWVPDDAVIIDELPHTATGKIDKKVLRARFSEFRFGAGDALGD